MLNQFSMTVPATMTVRRYNLIFVGSQVLQHDYWTKVTKKFA